MWIDRAPQLRPALLLFGLCLDLGAKLCQGVPIVPQGFSSHNYVTLNNFKPLILQ